MFKPRSFGLSHWFAVIGLVSIASISAVSGWLLSRFLTERMLQQEGRLTYEFVASIITVERADEYFVSGIGEPKAFEELFRHLSQFPDVLRANLYSRERMIMWSSDPTLIGRRFVDNSELEEALRGRLVVQGGEHFKTEHTDLDQSYPYFVEIYSPVWNKQRNEIVGAVELYRAPQALFAAISAGQRAVWIGAAVAGIFLYLTLFWMVRRADVLIRIQRERLVQSETLAVAGELGSAVAHGIRNPLASIRSSAELALESESEHWKEAGRDIVTQVDRIDASIRDLLSYSQPLADKLETVRLDVLMRATIESFDRELQRRCITASTRIDEGLPLVTVDPLLLGQVFNSLIANAVEAVERDGHIGVTVLRAGDRRLRVRIQDSGPGMTNHQLENAFKPYHTTKTKGMGVGLPLARRIVERFGGSIVIASELGEGTTVDVLLPAG